MPVVQISLFVIVLLFLVKPLGWYMARVYEGTPPRWVRFIGPVERLIYRASGVRADEEMNWKTYAAAMLVFNLIGMAAVYGLQRLQGFLPLNPQHLGAVAPETAFNTAASYVTNTNWQGYAGESTMSYFTQMAALTVQNFLSAATGMALLLPLVRGFARRTTESIGNFWVDVTRSTLYILLPLSVILAVGLVSQGVVQTLAPYRAVPLLDAAKHAKASWDRPAAGAAQKSAREQILALGPAASQVAIKQLGTNGGGFFNANSAHPFENPTPLTNFLELVAILLIPAALCYTFGLMVRDTRQGWMLVGVMTAVLTAFIVGCWWAEESGNPRFSALAVDQTPRDAGQPGPTVPALMTQAGGNMEGKEVRFGITSSVLWAVATTAASNGSVNSMHDSYTPLGGLFPMLLIQLGEVIFGGVGSGLAGMIVFVLATVFVAGLMVGRTPEYLGKKVEVSEMKMTALVILIMPVVVLACAASAGDETYLFSHPLRDFLPRPKRFDVSFENKSLSQHTAHSDVAATSWRPNLTEHRREHLGGV